MLQLTAPTKAHVQTDAPAVRRRMPSLFIVALGIFALFNACCFLFGPVKFDPYKFAYTGWSWWTMQDLRKGVGEYNVALLGSSLVASASAGCEGNYVQKSIDLAKYHQMQFLNDKFKEKLGGTFRTFNLSAPGQMPSDAYLMLKAMAVTGNRPDVVIYGVAPRDFIDSTLSAPCDTETFKFLSRIVSIDEVVHAEFRTVWSKLDWLIQKLVFLYGYSTDIRLVFAEATTKIADAVLPPSKNGTPFTYWDRVKLLPQYLPAEVHEGAVMAGPSRRADITFKDNRAEYHHRYRKPDNKTWGTQMHFLRKLAEYCRRERIELVLVNMPIMLDNVCLLPQGIYQKYRDALNTFAWNQNITYLDMCDFGRYVKEDYTDTVHLNAYGGTKFFEDLVARVVHDPRTNSALTMAGLQQARRTGLAQRQIDPHDHIH